jgi:uncharacterized repeat protein (TIGR02543 family)
MNIPNEYKCHLKAMLFMKPIQLLKRIFFLQVFFSFFLNAHEGAVKAQSTWKPGSGGQWGNATNWTPDGVPEGVGAVVNFTNNPTNLTEIIDAGTRTVGTINFGHEDAQFLYLFSVNQLILDASIGNAVINYNTSKINPSQSIFGSAIQMNDNLVVNINGEGGLLVFQKNITVSGGDHTFTIKDNTSTYNRGSRPMYTFQGTGNNFHKLVLDGKLNYNVSRSTKINETITGLPGIAPSNSLPEIVFASERATFLADAITLTNGGSFRSGGDGRFMISANNGIKLGVGGGGFNAPSNQRHWQINSVISGTEGGALRIMGEGSTVTLAAANTYNGATILDGGILVLGQNSSLPGTTMLLINDGAKVNPNGKTATVNTLFLDGVQRAAGTWGSASSTATNKNDTYFTGSGVITVTSAIPPSFYMVTYVVTNATNPTSGSMPAEQIKTHGSPLTLATNAGNLQRTGYVVDGWNTKADGTGTTYALGGTYNVNAHLRLYPKWRQVPTYTITYYGNEATSGKEPDPQIKTQDVPIVLWRNNGKIARTGYTFAGWNTSANGTGTDYAVGDTYNLNANLNLYAKWLLTSALPTSSTQSFTTIYPTVTSDMIYFKDLPESSRIVVVDLMGRKLLEENASEIHGGLSLSSFEKGVYLIRVMQAKRIIQSDKVFKE